MICGASSIVAITDVFGVIHVCIGIGLFSFGKAALLVEFIWILRSQGLA